MQKMVVAGALLFSSVGVGWALGGAASSSGQAAGAPARNAGVVQTKADPPMRCAGGQEVQLEALIEPSAVTSTDGKDTLEVEVSILSRRKNKGKFRYVPELVDDLGNAVGATTASTSGDVDGKGKKAKGGKLKVGPLDDGYYQYRVTAAAVSDKDEDTALGVLYLQAKGGKITTLDADEFLARSRANEEVVQ